MSIDVELKHISSIISTTEEGKFKVDEIQNHIDKVWQIINNKRRVLNDIMINRICKVITKLAIIVDAYKARMVRFESLKLYIEKEGLATDLIELSQNIS
ncbi:MAG: hypothetical protein OdinLCB4_000155 [Candidatus Odinarchaeum yellowstonii]|uniref:Uncharacterized protein n=1 Tax=Odinarchaeota yellowstonii (strain LCB_4) TaxID=1841599 RepID=A0AAF0D2F4_ODILC|nr:MAG: hypothetical protein OdinLCB4_000155 [Candidatus Odinarchaeum yellowstonii]